MKALTLTQPYATLVAIGAKRIETRSWSTRYRGPLAIHAGKGLGPVGGERGLCRLLIDHPYLLDTLFPDVRLWSRISSSELPVMLRSEMDATPKKHYNEPYSCPARPGRLQRGVIVAVCNLVGITNTEAVIDGYRVQRSDRGHVAYFSADSERAFGDYTPGRYAWLLADVRPVDPPIPATGRQGLWEWVREAG